MFFFANHWIIGIALFLGSFFAASALRSPSGGQRRRAVRGLVRERALHRPDALVRPCHGEPRVHDFFLAGSRRLLAGGARLHRSHELRAPVEAGFLVSRGLPLDGVVGPHRREPPQLFRGGTAFSLAIASVGVLLFGGYILFDTSRILRDTANRDAVGAAIGLYLNFLNLFIFLLRILSSSRRD